MFQPSYQSGPGGPGGIPFQPLKSLEFEGASITGNRDCILEFFVKKGCGGAVPNRGYDFRITLSIDLLIEKKSSL